MIVKRLMTIGALALLWSTGACAQQADPSQDPDWSLRQSTALNNLKVTDGWQTAAGGVRWRRIKGDGTGKHPTVADTVTLHYAGTLTTGLEFDSSYKRGEPATFPLSDLIEGWQIAVPLMGVGDVFEIAVPAEVGYGPITRGEIPGGATLFFKIELIGFEGA
ncbi:MAG: FKBP-type peptidyl-prolyl cis-trans isomerase [Sphingomonadales bacterium]|nr:MAG: FKBP-type peptidyl-prolyl cis-trans isomerase [Sphingomonadales bacterium]